MVKMKFQHKNGLLFNENNKLLRENLRGSILFAIFAAYFDILAQIF